MVARLDAVEEIRRFNRFYTNVIGVVDHHILKSPYSLTEVRILYEINNASGLTARSIRDILHVDEGYLSRTIDRLAKLGLINRRRSTEDGRSFLLSLSQKGRREFRLLNRRAEQAVASTIDALSADALTALVSMMRGIQSILAKGNRDDCAG